MYGVYTSLTIVINILIYKGKFYHGTQFCFVSFPGMVTDGEFDSLRTQGETRPVHIWQIIHDARESVSRQRAVTLEKMLKKLEVCNFNVGFICHL